MKLGNAGGAKGPDFWCAFEDGEVVVIGESLKTPSTTGAAGDCCVEGRRRELLTVPKPRAVGLLSVCLTVKPVGEPDALIGHVRFDERGWETERCQMAQATAPILDSTEPDLPACPLFGRYEGITGHAAEVAEST